MIINKKIVHLKPCDGLRLVAKHGSGVQGGKQRILACYNKGVSKKEFANFIKEECMNYGMGSPTVKPCYLHHLDFFRGIKYSYYDELGRNHEDCTATWSELADKIIEMIEDGSYLPNSGGGQMNEVQKDY